ncbi:MAG: deoxyribonuclease V [Chloroflexi bacterium]|nr:deoxyribonuclease V [Chloroflexota bacterium]
MKLKDLHPWNVTPEKAKSIQQQLAPQVSFTNSVPTEARWVAGVDISGANSDGLATGAVVVLDLPALEVQEVKIAQAVPGMPYIPGLLSFREVPVLAQALESLTIVPDIIMVDGQGVAHPRRFGIACHLGLLTDIPTIGCGKSILRGKHGPLETEQGSRAPLVDRDEVVGMALRTRSGVSPVYVSVGHKIDLESAVRWVLSCCGGLRIPEPTRLAHQAAAGRLAPRDPEMGQSKEETQTRLFV